jgi:hypothetical protein
MTGMPLLRTEYWNLSTGTVRGGATGHGESLTDVESYLLPLDQLRGSSLYGWGVANGLRVTAVSGQADVTVAPGAALDAAGHVVVLADGGFAVVDPTVDPEQVQNVPTIPVDAAGVVLPTAGSSGDQFVTLRWREVLGDSQLANAPVLLHAPWLRVQAVAGFQDVGEQVVLARVTLDADGSVMSLSAEGRRLVGVPAGRLELRCPRMGDPSLSVDQLPVAELRARVDGGVDLSLLPATGPVRPALSVQGQTGDLLLVPQDGNVGIGTAMPTAKLEIDRGSTNDVALRLLSSGSGWGSGLQLRNAASGAKTYGTYSGADGSWHFADADSQVDRLVVDPSGSVGIGIGAGKARRILHVEGSEIHSGGPGGGLSFMDRGAGGFVEAPGSGERWVWYAADGTARLWSGADRLTVSGSGMLTTGGAVDVGTVQSRANLRVSGDAVVGAGSNGVLTLRHINGKSATNDADDDLFLNWNTQRNVHVGGGAPAGLAVHGPLGVDGGVTLAAGTAISSPGRLHITGGERLYLLNHNGVIVSPAWGGTGNLLVQGRGGWPDDLPLPPWSGGGIGSWDIFARGAVYVGNDPANPAIRLVPNGTKQFVIDHPLDPDRQTLAHACIEGPEAAVYYRGEGRLVGGTARVELPEYFEGIARPDGRTVMLTPVSAVDEPVTVLAATPVAGGGFDVRAADCRNPNQRFCWEVKAVRADVERLKVESVKNAASLKSW